MSTKTSQDLSGAAPEDVDRRAVLQQSLYGGMALAGVALGGLSGEAAAQSNGQTASAPTVRRVVTGNNAQGKSYFLKDEIVKYGTLWTNNPEEILGAGAPGDLKTLQATSVPRLDPPNGGAMLQFLAMQPSTKKRGTVLDKTLGNGAPNKDGFHRTSTIDYIYMVSGEVNLVLDEGETTLHAGDIVIQRNTSHAWQNYGSVPATLFVMNIRVWIHSTSIEETVMVGRMSSLIDSLKIGRRALLGRLFIGAAAAGSALGSMPRAAFAADDKAAEPISISLFAMFVSDLDRSVAFYQALGFEGGEARNPPAAPNPGPNKLYQTPGAVVNRSVRKDGITLEFLHFEAEKLPARKGRELGLSHISLRVDDVDRVAGLIKKMGGSVFEETRIANGTPGKGVQIMFCADPDGARLALLGPIKA